MREMFYAIVEYIGEFIAGIVSGFNNLVDFGACMGAWNLTAIIVGIAIVIGLAFVIASVVVTIQEYCTE